MRLPVCGALGSAGLVYSLGGGFVLVFVTIAAFTLVANWLVRNRDFRIRAGMTGFEVEVKSVKDRNGTKPRNTRGPKKKLPKTPPDKT